MKSLSQMPVVLIPVHFDRDPLSRIPSCQRSVVIRTFITNDFMTGVPATIDKEIPEHVSGSFYYHSIDVLLIHILYPPYSTLILRPHFNCKH